MSGTEQQLTAEQLREVNKVNLQWMRDAELAIKNAQAESALLAQKIKSLETNAKTGGPKPNKPESYNGTTKEHVDIWCFEMDQYFKATGLPESRQVAFATSFFHGAAATWWRTLVIMADTNKDAKRIETWKELCVELIKQFKPIKSIKTIQTIQTNPTNQIIFCFFCNI